MFFGNWKLKTNHHLCTITGCPVRILFSKVSSISHNFKLFSYLTPALILNFLQWIDGEDFYQWEAQQSYLQHHHLNNEEYHIFCFHFCLLGYFLKLIRWVLLEFSPSKFCYWRKAWRCLKTCWLIRATSHWLFLRH